MTNGVRRRRPRDKEIKGTRGNIIALDKISGTSEEKPLRADLRPASAERRDETVF